MTLSNNQIKLINSLHSKKGRIDNNLFLVEGEKGIRELVDSNFKIEFIVLNSLEDHSNLNIGETLVYYESKINVIDNIFPVINVKLSSIMTHLNTLHLLNMDFGYEIFKLGKIIIDSNLKFHRDFYWSLDIILLSND